MHLSPVHGNAVLRPCLDYIDQLKEQEKERNSKLVERQNASKEPGEAKLIQVSVRSNEDKEALKKAATNQLLRKEQDEPWKEATFYNETVENLFYS